MPQHKVRQRQPTADAQHVLEHLTVRPVQPHEVERFDALSLAPHYLKSARVVGAHIRYVATPQGQWLQPRKTRWTVRRYQQRFAHRDGGPARLQALMFAQSPTAWRLPK